MIRGRAMIYLQCVDFMMGMGWISRMVAMLAQTKKTSCMPRRCSWLPVGHLGGPNSRGD